MSNSSLVTLTALATIACGTSKTPAVPASQPASVPAPTPAISNTEVRSLQSTIVNQEYRLYIAHPVPAGPAGQKYPVVYTLDANGAFGMVTETIRLGSFGGELPPTLVVGIGYPVGGFEETMNLRMRDYTPTSDTTFVSFAVKMWGGGGDARSGGAESFLRFIREELKPYIEKNFPADSANATLIGDSFGGLFATYALLHHPETFQRYVIASPSLFWDKRVSFEYEKQYAANHKDLPVQVFLAAGGLETAVEAGKSMQRFPEQMRKAMAEYWEKTGAPEMVELIGPFVKALEGRKYPGLRITSHIFPNETHLSVPPSVISRGLRVVFGTYTGH